jgi:uncharacterized membrane protein
MRISERSIEVRPRFMIRLAIPMAPMLFLGLTLISPLVFLVFTILIAVGVNPVLAFTLTIVSLLSSPLNLVFLEITYYVMPIVDFLKLVPWLYTPPQMFNRLSLAFNVGGSVIPIAASAYLMTYMLGNTAGFIFFLASLAISSYVIRRSSRIIPGVGIVVPNSLPLILTVSLTIISHAVTGVDTLAFSYSLGSLSTLIGADLLNLGRVVSEMRGFVSIGGAGVFDGIYLTGLMSLILVSIYRLI